MNLYSNIASKSILKLKYKMICILSYFNKNMKKLRVYISNLKINNNKRIKSFIIKY